MQRSARTAAVSLAAALAIAPRVGRAQGAHGPQGPRVALAQVLARASERAPEVLVSAARISVAAAEPSIAAMLTNPSVTVGSSLYSSRFYTAVVFQLPLFGQRGAAIDASEALLAAARRDIDVTRLDVRLGASGAYLDFWLADREADAARAAAERSGRLLEVTAERERTGTAPHLDTLRARAEALRQRAEADAAALLVGAAAARLAVWIDRGESEPATQHAGDELAAPPAVPALAALLSRLAEHPAVRAARAREHAAELNITLEERRRLPLVGIELGGNFFNAPDNGPPANDLHVALTFEVPVFHLHGPLIARAQTARVQARLEAEVARLRLAAEVTAAHASLSAIAARARAQEDEVLPATREAAELALEAYNAGRLDINAVIAAQQALAEATLALRRLQAERARAFATLEHAAGVPL